MDKLDAKKEDVVTIEIWADSYFTKYEFLCYLIKNNIQEKIIQDNK